jgi:TetR/AcrR family transcriptional regulator, regulator of autoinduction and epiphytic fitness
VRLGKSREASQGCRGDGKAEATLANEAALSLDRGLEVGASISGIDDYIDIEPADGRAARSHRTRRAIIDAMRALHAEGDLRPTVPRIAERAGVSLRTVWQQFADRESLLVEAVRRDREILKALVGRIEQDQPLAERVESFVAQRTRVLEEMTPTWRAARIHEPFSDALLHDKKWKTARGRAELEQVFAPELDQLATPQRDQLVEALHAVSIWAFWETLRSELGLSPLRARELLSRTFTALFAQAGFQLA